MKALALYPVLCDACRASQPSLRGRGRETPFVGVACSELGTGRDGMGRDGTGRDGTGRDRDRDGVSDHKATSSLQLVYLLPLKCLR